MSEETPLVALIATSQSCGHCNAMRGGGFMEPTFQGDKRAPLGGKYYWEPDFFQALITATPYERDLIDMMKLKDKQLLEKPGDPTAIREKAAIQASLGVIESRKVRNSTSSSVAIARERDVNKRQTMIAELTKLQKENPDVQMIKVYAIQFPQLRVPPFTENPHPQSTITHLDEFIFKDGKVVQRHYYPEKQGAEDVTFVKDTDKNPELFVRKPFGVFVTSLIPDDIVNFIPYFPSLFISTRKNWNEALVSDADANRGVKKSHLYTKMVSSGVIQVKDPSGDLYTDAYGPKWKTTGEHFPAADAIKIAWRVANGFDPASPPEQITVKTSSSPRAVTVGTPITTLPPVININTTLTPPIPATVNPADATTTVTTTIPMPKSVKSVGTNIIVTSDPGNRLCAPSYGTRFISPKR
jgi:hypothetical protein